MKRACLLILIPLMGCHAVDRLNGHHHHEQLQKIVIMGSGQSNAGHSELWERINDLMQGYGYDSSFGFYAKSNTSSFQWASNDECILDEFSKEVCLLKPTDILWMQGEGDAFTSPEEYADNITVVINKARTVVPNVRFWVALESYDPNNVLVGRSNVRDGQRLLVSRGVARPGIDADSFRTPELTVAEGLHFNPEGLEKLADRWVALLKTL